MTVGIIANTTKANVFEVIFQFIGKLKENGIDYFISKSIMDKDDLDRKIRKTKFVDEIKLLKKSDIILSFGGDGTMLTTAYKAQFYNKPVAGINMGKLGFLAEINIEQIDLFIKELKNNTYIIEERMILTGECIGHNIDKLYAVNDIVIDKGGWPKMIELTIIVNGEYVTTFSADGIIAATPTGTTGYSISTGGPIVNPKADVITLSPISPHSLTIKPIVLPGDAEIIIKSESLHKEIQVNCDGQRVFAFKPPLEIRLKKSSRPVKLIQTQLTSYFKTLRNKLLWGIDLRKSSLSNKDEV